MTDAAGMVVIGELNDVLRVDGHVSAATGPIKVRERGLDAGGLLVGMAAAQLAGEDFLVGLDRRRGDEAGKALLPVPIPAASTAAGLAERFTEDQWRLVEAGVGRVQARAVWPRLSRARRARLSRSVTIDIDSTDVEVYGRRKQGVAYNYEGRRVGSPHVACWAENETAVAARLLSGDEDPRASMVDMLDRGLAGIPEQALQGLRASGGKPRLRADTAYFAGDLARAAHAKGMEFAIGAKRLAPLWRTLDGIAEGDWVDAVDMAGAQVAVSRYRPADWPPETMLLIRRVRLSLDQIPGADPRSRRRRTLHPEQRALPLAELAGADAVHAYSFIVTNCDISTPENAAAVEHWYRRRTTIENLFRDGKHGAALRHLPSGKVEVNTAWMWAALLAVNFAAWLHELTGVADRHGQLSGWGVREGKAMIATLRHRVIRVPGRLVSHAGQHVLRLPPRHHDLIEVLRRRIQALA